MFDDKTKRMDDQLLEEMVRQGYGKEEIELARYELKENKNLKFAMNLAKTLSFLEASKIIFEKQSLEKVE